MSVAVIDADALADCCGSRRWQTLMADAPVDGTEKALQVASERAFDALAREDWLEAFAAHARIGESRPGDATGAQEQAGVGAADDTVRAALAADNAAYRERFGFVFLIRARGRSAEEMLEQLQQRLENAPETEFANACAQQREITALRLATLVAPAASSDTAGGEGSFSRS